MIRARKTQFVKDKLKLLLKHYDVSLKAMKEETHKGLFFVISFRFEYDRNLKCFKKGGHEQPPLSFSMAH